MPEIFIKISEIFAMFLTPLRNVVNNPAKIIIIPCPIENKNSISAASAKFLDNTAKLIIPASIGVEQGLDESAKIIPIKTGYKNRLAPSFLGIFLIMGEKLMSMTPNKLSPKIRIKEAKNSIKYAPPNDEKTLPVTAQIIPIIVKTSPKPNTKKHNCINVFNLLLSEYPPTYPTIRGKTPKEQGEIDARTPPKNDIKRKISENSPFDIYSTKEFVIWAIIVLSVPIY